MHNWKERKGEGLEGEGLERNVLEGEGLKGQGLDWLDGKGSHLQHINKAEEKKLRKVYLHESWWSSLPLLWNHLTSASADTAMGQCPAYVILHTPEKAKTEMISTRIDNWNNIHPCTIEKKERGRAGGRGTGRFGLKGEGLQGQGLEGEGLDWLEGDWGHIQH